MKLSLAMIVKDTPEEATLLDNCLRSVAEHVDEIVLVATYNDQPGESVKSVGAKYNARVYDFAWIDDFAAGREFSFSKVSGDWILWLDADDTVDHPELLKKACDPRADAVFLEYYYDVDKDGVVKTKHWRERLIQNNGAFNWKGRLHETLIENRQTRKIKNDTVHIIHHLTDERHSENLVRNMNILEAQVKAEENAPDPRTMYNLAVVYIDAGMLADAAHLLDIYLTYSGWAEERCQAQCQLATIKKRFGKDSEALEHYLAAIKEFPQNPVPYVWLGEIYCRRQQWDKALAWLEMALQKTDPSDSMVVWNTLEYTYLPLALYAQASMYIGKIDQALNAVKKAHTFKDDKDIAEMEDLLVNLKGDQLATQSFVDLARYMEKRGHGKQIHQLLQAVPKNLADNPIILSLKKQTSPAKKWPRKSVVIYCGESAIEAWGPWSLAEGIGGSEEAVIRLSRQLVDRGYAVTVYGTPGDRAGEYDGVIYRNSWEFDVRDRFNIFVSWRSPWILDANIKADKVYLWLHDVVPEGELTVRRLQKLAKIIVLSAYHRSLFPKVSDDKFLISANGIDAAEFEEGRWIPNIYISGKDQSGRPAVADGGDYLSKIKRDRYQILYASSHTRGLTHLLDIWPQVKVRVPQAHLEIFYGWDSFVALNRDNPERMDWMEKVQKKIEVLDGVTDHGKVSQQRVIEESFRSAVWAYPTLFPEISCITAMKAQAAGAVPVVNNYAALKETVQFGDKTEFENWDKAAAKEYTNLLVDMLVKTERQKDIRAKMMPWARKHFSWSKVAQQWIEEFGQ